MASIHRFEDIVAWQKARVLVREIYKMCAIGPLAKDYGLKNQLCRAAVSGMTNIAEGFARKTHNDFAHFLDIARGSCVEVQSLLYAALDVDYITQETFDKLYRDAADAISLISKFAAYLRSD